MFKANNNLISLLLVIMLTTSCAITTEKSSVGSDFKDIAVDASVKQEFDRAVVLLRGADYDGAITLLKNVVEKEKRLTAPFINLGMAYNKKGDRKSAEEAFKKALEIDLSHPMASNELGLMYRRSGRFEDAKKAYSNALTKHADYLPIIKNLGILCEIYMQDLECALEQFERYMEHVPDDKTVRVWVADLKRRTGR